MICTINLNEYVLLSVLKNICKKGLDIKYEPEQEEQIKENENAEEKQCLN